MAQIHALTPEGRLPSTGVEHVEEILGDIPDRVAPIQEGEQGGLSVTDETGRQALGVTPDGGVVIGSTEYQEQTPGYRIIDPDGKVAFEVDGSGRTHIYDLATGGGNVPDVPVVPITTLHVFLAVGQSNMQGRGFPIEGPESPRIMQYGANRRVLEQAPLQLDHVPGVAAGTGPATFFAHHYLASQPDHVGVLLIPAAMGGTKFTWAETSDDYTWTNGTAINPEHGLYERSVAQTLEAVTAAETAGYHVIIKGVLWHQGEGNGGTPTEQYAAALDALISDYRNDLDHATLPFMVGQQCPEGMEIAPAKYTVDTAHQDTPARTPYTGFAASTWNGHNDGDTTHFSTVGTSHLGDTYAAAYIEALGNVHHHATESAPEQTTGWIDFTDTLTGVISGRALRKRTGTAVVIAFDELLVDSTGTYGMPRLDSAYWPQFRMQESWYVVNSSLPPTGIINISPTGYFNVYNTDPGKAMAARIEYDTDRPFPV